MLNTPKRQEPKGVILAICISIYKVLRAIWPLLLFVFLKNENNYTLLFTTSTLLVITVTFSVLRFKAFTFYIDTINNEFVLQKGFFSKEKIIIKLDKIFEINIEQKHLHILLDIYKVKLDTAGSDKDEIVIESLSKSDVDFLRNYIIDYKNQSNSKEKNNTTNLERDCYVDITNISDDGIKISFWSLIKNSLISNYLKTLGIVLLFFNSIFDNIQHFNEEVLTKYLGDFNIVQTLSSSVAFTGLVFVCLFLVLNLLFGVLQHFGYEIKIKSETVLIKYGLIQKFQIVIQPQKIQYFIFTTSKLMELLNINTLRLALIGNPEEKRQKNMVTVPALSKAELHTIEDFLKINTFNGNNILYIKPNFRMVLKNMFVFTAIFLAITGYFFFLNIENINEYQIFSFLLTIAIIFWLVVLWIQILYYKWYYISLLSNKLVVIQGVFNTKTTVLPLQKIQAIQQKQLWWHVKNKLCRLEIKTAGGTIILPIASKTKYDDLINFILYSVESNNESWT